MKFYVAYGSNLNISQMARRCPDASIVGKGIIPDYALKYRGSKTGSFATIIPEKGKYVPVVVWRISPSDEKSLDCYEGFPTFYYKKKVKVILESRKSLKVMAYIMNDQAKVGIPSNRYIRTVLEGYMENNLDYNILIDSLEDNEKEMGI